MSTTVYLRESSAFRALSGPGSDVAIGGTFANAGLLPGVGLTTHSGDLTLTSANSNQTFQNLHITGKILVNTGAHDILLYNCQNDADVEGSGLAGTQNITFQHCDMHAMFLNGIDNLTVDLCYLHDAVDGPHMQFQQSINGGTGAVLHEMNNTTITNNRFEGLTSHGTAHVENCHPRGISGMLFQGNYCDQRVDATTLALGNGTSCFTSEATNRRCSDMVIDNNEFHSNSVYQVYFNFYGTSRVTNNRFNGVSQNSIQFNNYSSPGLQFPEDSTYHPFTQSGNTLDGAPTTLWNGGSYS